MNRGVAAAVTRKGPEAQIQAAIVDALHYLYPRGSTVVWFAVPNEQRRTAVGGAAMKAIGRQAGVADLVLMAPGRPVLFLEVKSSTGRQRRTQREFETWARNAGQRYEVCRSPDRGAQEQSRSGETS